MAKTNGKKQSDRDIRLATVIAGAITDTLVPVIREVRDEVRQVSGRLDATNERLDGMNGRLDEVNGRLDEVNRRLGNLEAGAVGIGRITKLEERVGVLEKKIL